MSIIGLLLRRRDPAPEPGDPMEPYYRARLVKLHIDRLSAEALACDDRARRLAIHAEIQVCIESLREIHREQLVAQLERTRA